MAEMKLAALVATRRELAKLSRERLAAAANVSTSTIVRLENAQHVPSVGALVRIADVLGIDQAEMLDAAAASARAVAS